MTCRDVGVKKGLKNIVERDANRAVDICVRKTEWFIANLLRAMGRLEIVIFGRCEHRTRRAVEKCCIECK